MNSVLPDISSVNSYMCCFVVLNKADQDSLPTLLHSTCLLPVLLSKIGSMKNDGKNARLNMTTLVAAAFLNEQKV